jgi:hypothetical protein
VTFPTHLCFGGGDDGDDDDGPGAGYDAAHGASGAAAPHEDGDSSGGAPHAAPGPIVVSAVPMERWPPRIEQLVLTHIHICICHLLSI